jgi:hypothetical protein
MYTDPMEVKRLIGWCCEWCISMEDYLKDNIRQISGYRGVWGTSLPDGAVFINGDPVDLIKPDFVKEFDLPYSSKLFNTIGGGFFHHHSVGLFQVDQVSKIEGMTVQNIYNDYPNTKDMTQHILEDKEIQEKIISSSFTSPIFLEGVLYRYIDDLIPILRQGRFIVSVVCNSRSEIDDCIDKIKKVNSLK